MSLSKKSIIISSDSDGLIQVEIFLTDVLESFRVNKKLFHRILLCLNEAVMNSIVHGNKFREEKTVSIDCFCCKRYLYFRIVDEGEGFNFEDLADPTLFQNIKKESGRGIFIIKNMSDGIFFREKGNILEFKIERGGEN